MNYLSCHPQVIAYRDYPFETRLAQYYAHTLNVLLSPPPDDPRVLDVVIDGRPYSTGNPYSTVIDTDWQDEKFGKQLKILFLDTIDHNYRQEALKQDKKPLKFLEKVHVLTPALVTLGEMYPNTNELFLIRDPRAILASMFSFNKKRGFDGFGLEDASADQFAERLQLSFERIRDCCEKSGALLIRYEDLVTDAEVVLQNIFRHFHLSTEWDEAPKILKAVAGMKEIRQHHSTTENNEQSLSAWKDILKPEYNDALLSRLQDIMTYFNYLP